jgi:hypothetical protein
LDLDGAPVDSPPFRVLPDVVLPPTQFPYRLAVPGDQERLTRLDFGQKPRKLLVCFSSRYNPHAVVHQSHKD